MLGRNSWQDYTAMKADQSASMSPKPPIIFRFRVFIQSASKEAMPPNLEYRLYPHPGNGGAQSSAPIFYHLQSVIRDSHEMIGPLEQIIL